MSKYIGYYVQVWTEADGTERVGAEQTAVAIAETQENAEIVLYGTLAKVSINGSEARLTRIVQVA